MNMLEEGNFTLGNAAGVVKRYDEAKKLLGSAATRITVGSITVERRRGNLGETYYYHPERKSAWNALGIPNPGLSETLEWLPRFREECRQHKQELAVSIAGFAPAEYMLMASQLKDVVDWVEVNCGCGNLWGQDGQKKVPSYHPELFKTILDAVARTLGSSKTRMTVKISPLAGTPELRQTLEAVGKVIATNWRADEVIATNTEINQSATRVNGKPALAFREEQGATTKFTGGLSGEELRPKSLQVVSMLAATLPSDKRIIGCGGVFTGQHFVNYLEAGANGAVCATHYIESRENPKVFSDLLEEASRLYAPA